MDSDYGMPRELTNLRKQRTTYQLELPRASRCTRRRPIWSVVIQTADGKRGKKYKQVPRSSEKLREDNEYTLYTVTLFKRVADNFKMSAHEKGPQVRDFEPNSEAQESHKQDIEKLMQNQENLRGSLLQWCYASYGEVLEARRARRTQQRRIDAEASPEILALASSSARQTSVTTTEASPAAPQRTHETHQMLCSKLNEIEQSAKAYMKRAPKQPSKMITTRRTLMSMR